MAEFENSRRFHGSSLRVLRPFTTGNRRKDHGHVRSTEIPNTVVGLKLSVTPAETTSVRLKARDSQSFSGEGGWGSDPRSNLSTPYIF